MAFEKHRESDPDDALDGQPESDAERALRENDDVEPDYEADAEQAAEEAAIDAADAHEVISPSLMASIEEGWDRVVVPLVPPAETPPVSSFSAAVRSALPPTATGPVAKARRVSLHCGSATTRGPCRRPVRTAGECCHLHGGGASGTSRARTSPRRPQPWWQGFFARCRKWV